MTSVLHLSTSDIAGGASRAAYRLHRSLFECSSIYSRLLVAYNSSCDPSVQSLTSLQARILPLFSSASSYLASHLLTSSDYKSLSISPISLIDMRIVNSYDIVHLHWIQGEFLPLWFLRKIKRPVVWTLHDLWPILGFNHYSSSSATISSIDSFYHFVKYHLFPSNLSYHCTTPWSLSQFLDKPHLARHPKYCIPYALDTNIFTPRNSCEGRHLYGIPADKTVLLFGAIGGTQDCRKGWQLLLDALPIVMSSVPDLHIVLLGQHQNSSLERSLSCSYTFIPHVHDDRLLSYIYSMADITVVPSRVETFGQLASESISCGTPVIAFNTSALSYVVQHMRTGLHAHPFCSISLAAQITRLARDIPLRLSLSEQCVEYSRKHWSYSNVSSQLSNMYESILR